MARSLARRKVPKKPRPGSPFYCRHRGRSKIPSRCRCPASCSCKRETCRIKEPCSFCAQKIAVDKFVVRGVRDALMCERCVVLSAKLLVERKKLDVLSRSEDLEGNLAESLRRIASTRPDVRAEFS